MGSIRRNLRHSKKDFKQKAYISLVRSVMEYACTVWDPYLNKDIDKLEGVQRRAARFVTNDYRRHSRVTKMMKELKWQPLHERRREKRLVFFHKIVYDLVAVSRDSILQLNQRKQRTSNSKCVKIIHCNTKTCKNSFVPRTISCWNYLPDSMVLHSRKEDFKAALTNFLKSNYQTNQTIGLSLCSP